MIRKKILVPERIRQNEGSFAFIPHRFLSDGFLAKLNQHELLLYLFLIIAADRYGLSFYSSKSICPLIGVDLDQYVKARDGLIKKNLVAFDGTIFQVLSLPVPLSTDQRRHPQPRKENAPVSIAQVLQSSLRGLPYDR